MTEFGRRYRRRIAVGLRHERSTRTPIARGIVYPYNAKFGWFDEARSRRPASSTGRQSPRAYPRPPPHCACAPVHTLITNLGCQWSVALSAAARPARAVPDFQWPEFFA